MARQSSSESIEPQKVESKLDFNSLIQESKSNIETQKPKRHRRTKAEIEASRTLQNQNQSQQLTQAVAIQPVDRTAQLKPAFLLYSDLFLAKPLEIPELKFSDEESEALAKVTNDLMNAFPEYFNSSDPKVAAIISAAFVAGPIGFSKYKIIKNHKAKKLEVQNDAQKV